MIRWAEKRVAELKKDGLMGFIFKSNSPSCGMERVKVYDEKARTVRKGVGLFAQTCMKHFPLLPVEEEGRLRDPASRIIIIERAFALAGWEELPDEIKRLSGRIE
jgi:uncharacterized protein YbbK (DUF523 family)